MSRGTLDPAAYLTISPTGLSPSLGGFPKTLRLSFDNGVMQSSTPENQGFPVWPFSLSLAATKEIDFSFYSCRYLDVSVPGVSLRMAMDSPYGD